MSATLTREQAQALDDRQNEAIANLKRFNYAYTPAPMAPYPSSMAEIKKYVTITPIGTYAPNVDGTNPVADKLMKLPNKQTPETCIANAAMLKSRTLSSTPFNNPPVVGTAKSITKNIESQKLVRNIEKEMRNVIEKQKKYRDEIRTGKKQVTEPTKVLINGLHFRATKNGSGYMGDTPDYFNKYPDRIDIDTSSKTIYTDEYLPTNFANLLTATTTNATPDKSVYNIYPNMICTLDDAGNRGCYWSRPQKPDNVPNDRYDRHFFAVEWSGFFKPNQTGEWVFTTDSDDASFLWVDSDNIKFGNGPFTVDNSTVNNRGLHGMDLRSSDGRVKLNMTKDQLYRIKIQFSENGGGYGMSVTAKCKNGGSRITNFTGFFFAEVTKMVEKNVDYTYTERVEYEEDVTVQKQVDVVVYNKSGAPEKKTISMGDMFNPTYSINDVNAVYVSMVKDPTVPSNTAAKYDCYVSNPNAISSLNTTFNSVDVPIYNVIDLWQSSAQGNVNDNTGYCNLNSTGSVLLDNSQAIRGLQDTQIQNTVDGNVPDEIPYMYIAENTDGNVTIPSMVIIQKSTNSKKTIDITTDATYKDIIAKCKSGELKQFANKTWISDQACTLAYNAKNEPDDPSLGIIYKITNTTALISISSTFRLIMKNGRLTLQMAVNPTRLLNENDPSIKYTQNVISKVTDNPTNLTPNTYALLKVDVDHRMNSVNLLDKAENKSLYVPDDYVVFNNKYSTYSNNYPSKSRIDEGYVANSQTCMTDCNNSADCRAFYTYTKGSTEMCTLVGGTTKDISKFPATDNPQLFSPVPPAEVPDITKSSLSIKNKTVDPKYNDPANIYKIDNIMFNNGNSTTEKQRIFYPDQKYDNANRNCTPNADGTLNCDPVFEHLKELVRIRTKDKSDALSRPTDASSILSNITSYVDAGAIVNTTENYTNIREAYTSPPLTVSQGTTDNVKTMCAPGYTKNTYGLCEITKKLNTINDLQATSQTKSEVLDANMSAIKSKIAAVDDQFRFLSNNTDNNYYKYDFNDYDDKPDTSMLGAIERDTNVLLLHENTMYIVGTIVTTSLAILGVILARG